MLFDVREVINTRNKLIQLKAAQLIEFLCLAFFNIIDLVLKHLLLHSISMSHLTAQLLKFLIGFLLFRKNCSGILRHVIVIISIVFVFVHIKNFGVIVKSKFKQLLFSPQEKIVKLIPYFRETFSTKS